MKILESRYVRYSVVALYEPLGLVLLPQARLREACPREYPVMQGFGEILILADPDAGQFLQMEDDRLRLRCDKPEEADHQVLQETVRSLLHLVGAKLKAVDVNYHRRFRVGGEALAAVRVLLSDLGATGASIVDGAVVGGGVRLVCNRPDGRYDMRVEAGLPSQSSDELICHMNIHRETDELGNLLLQGDAENAYFNETVARLCESVPEGDA